MTVKHPPPLLLPTEMDLFTENSVASVGFQFEFVGVKTVMGVRKRSDQLLPLSSSTPLLPSEATTQAFFVPQREGDDDIPQGPVALCSNEKAIH